MKVFVFHETFFFTYVFYSDFNLITREIIKCSILSFLRANFRIINLKILFKALQLFILDFDGEEEEDKDDDEAEALGSSFNFA